MITIIDTGIANVASIKNMIYRCGSEAEIAASPKDAENASKIILPGVGAFDAGMDKIIENGWNDFLDDYVLRDNKIILGICLGMHFLTHSSEEGNRKGLSYIDAETIRFDKNTLQKNQKVPHMGWNEITRLKKSNLFNDLESEERFYFVHSYHVNCNDAEDILTTTDYGNNFHSAFKKDNIIGVQFHPEKSHRFGVDFFKNFITLKDD